MRVNVFAYSEWPDDSPPVRVGRFTVESAVWFREEVRADGTSVNTEHAALHQGLYRTASSRWVLQTMGDDADYETRYEFLGDDAACEWLTLNRHDEALEQYFGEQQDEPGPVNLGGRPRVGPKGEVRLTKANWARVDALAAGRKRADILRDLVERGLAVAESARATGQGTA